MFKVGDKVNVYENGEQVTELEGRITRVTEDRVYASARNTLLPDFINDMLAEQIEIPHNLDGIAIVDEEGNNEGYSIRLKEE